MRAKQRVQGKFVSCSGFRKVVCPPGGRYELIIVDQEARPISHVTEWYRLRKAPGPNGTRRTYLNFLLPFFAYLLQQEIAWNDEPARLRHAVKDFLLHDVSCHVGRDPALDGYRIDLTGASPLAPSSLRVLLAAIRDFYAMMIEAGLYAHPNPMCSALLQRWKREQVKTLANSGAPDHAGIREETRAETNRQPTAYFRQRRGEAWKPDPALTSEHIQRQLAADLTWMTHHAPTQRDRLVLLLLRETGARLSEILCFTAGGIAKPKIPTKHMSSTRGAPDAKKNSFTFLQPARRLSSGMSAQSGHGLIHMDANGLLIWMMVIPFFSRDGGRRTAERHSTITGVLCTLHDLHRKPADFHWPRSNLRRMISAIYG
jgi:hypothetical protein